MNKTVIRREENLTKDQFKMDLPGLSFGTFKLFIVKSIILVRSFRLVSLIQDLSLRAGRAISVVCQRLSGLHKLSGVACLSSILTGGFARTARVTTCVCLGVCSRLYNNRHQFAAFGCRTQHCVLRRCAQR